MNPEIASSRSAKKRKITLAKKAEELSVLCGVPVALVCVGPGGAVETWPQEQEKVGEILRLYLEKTGKRSSDSDSDEAAKKGKKLRYQSWHPELDYLPEESLIGILKDVERKEKMLEERKNEKNKRGLGIRISDESEHSSSQVTGVF